MKEKSIVLNMMQGEPGEILERGRCYSVRKLEGGGARAEYSNLSQEPAVLKLTLTALEPYARFQVLQEPGKPAILTANAAGILEGRFQILPGRKLCIEKIGSIERRKTNGTD